MSTVERNQWLTDKFVSRRTGIVTELIDINNNLDGIEIYGNIARIASVNYLSYDPDSETVGFSFESRAEAEIKAIMEGIERYSSAIVYEQDITTYDETSGEIYHFLDYFGSDINPESLLYRPFTTSDGQEIHLPAQYAYFPYYGLDESLIVENTTNGLAAHVSSEQARANAVLELVEREAILRFWLNRVALPSIELEGTDLELIDNRLSDQDLDLNIFKAKIVNEIETAFAFITSSSDDQPFLSFGASAAFSLQDAVTEAVVECLHMRIWQRHYYDGKPSKPERIKGMFDRAQYWSSEPDDRKISFVFNNPACIALADSPEPREIDDDTLRRALLNGKFDLPQMYFADVTVPHIAAEGIHVWRAFCPEFHPFHLSGTGDDCVVAKGRPIIDGQPYEGTNQAIPHPML